MNQEKVSGWGGGGIRVKLKQLFVSRLDLHVYQNNLHGVHYVQTIYRERKNENNYRSTNTEISKNIVPAIATRSKHN